MISGALLIPTFTDDALCNQTDPEAFFPDKGESTKAAKAVCALCQVRPECLDYAIANDERFGVWGGHSERERRKIRAGLPLRPAKPKRPKPVRGARLSDELIRAAGGRAIVRAWARHNGFQISERGNIPRAVLDAYLSANPETDTRRTA